MNSNYQYKTCRHLADHTLGFFDRIDTGEKCIKFCCEFREPEGVPTLAFKETAEETVDAYLALWKDFMDESKRISSQGGTPEITTGCTKCPLYIDNHWLSDGLIRYVFLSMYPSPCQCHCTYCDLYQEGKTKLPLDEAARQAYEKLFDVIEVCEKRKLILKDALWAVACGELSIHPYRERILNLVDGKQVVFHSNCFKFDEGIANHLRKYPKSKLSFSIDAGTPEAWKKVKGYDNFAIAVENLERYVKNIAYPGQILLKFIILPGMNDRKEDFEGVIKIIKHLGIERLLVARDLRFCPELSHEEKAAAASIIAMCFKNGIVTDLNQLVKKQEEKIEIKQMAQDLLQKM